MHGVTKGAGAANADPLNSVESKLLEEAKVKQAGGETQGPSTSQMVKPEGADKGGAVQQAMATSGLVQAAVASLEEVKGNVRESTIDNPLLHLTGFPAFSLIRPEHALPAVEKAIADCRAMVEKVAQHLYPSWGSVCVPLAECKDRLEQISSLVSHMKSVVNSPEIRSAHEACLPLLSDHETWIGQHKGLYEAYKVIEVRRDFPELSQAQQQAVKHFLRDSTLSGIDLNPKDQRRFTEIERRLSEISSTFSNNVLDATMGWTKHVLDKNLLFGLPESALVAAKEKAAASNKEGYLFSLEFPSFSPLMSYCENRELRAEMYEAYVTRASDKGPNAGKWDNTALMNEALLLKHESASLLGFSNYAEKSLATKMATSTEQVLTFLNGLADKTKPQGRAEFETLTKFAQQHLNLEKLEAWDISYCTQKLKKDKYQISSEELRPYFPESQVVSGLFEVVKRVFGVTVRPRTGVEVWNESVTCYDVFDEEGELRGSFYFDIYARDNKEGGAWMGGYRDRRVTQSGDLQTPVAYITCNFNKPTENKPALFTHDEVTTLFHEFGHALHHMLTKVDVSSVSGINGVAWDCVELPSQFLENWCWQEEALSFISGHYETKEPLPKEMLEKMLAAKNFQSAMGILRQLEFGLFDFTLFSRFNPEYGPQVLETLAEIKAKVSVTPSPEWNRFPHAFSHIFSGGYSAGYYGYLWAEVLSADAFERFKEEGIFNQETGSSFLQHILEKGGSEDAMTLFTRFRGREPSPDALLEDRGVIKAADGTDVSRSTRLRFS